MTERYQHFDDSFNKFVIVSVVIHFSFLLFFTVKNLIMPSTVIEMPHSIRVDMVALPDKIDMQQPIQPITKKETVAPPPPAPKPVAKVNLEKPAENLKATQKKALEKITAMEALEKIKNEINQKSQKPKETVAATKPLKGNIISSGNDFSGLSKLKVNEFFDKLRSKIQQHWELPQWLSSANLKATLLIEIDERGYIVKNEIQVSSGNKVFDSMCIAAVTRASPIEPPPPSEIAGALITIRFPFE